MAKWEELPIADRAQYMRVAVQNGYRDIRTIREAYNKYAEGGLEDEYNRWLDNNHEYRLFDDILREGANPYQTFNYMGNEEDKGVALRNKSGRMFRDYRDQEETYLDRTLPTVTVRPNSYENGGFINPYSTGHRYTESSECAYFSNHTLNDHGYMMSGNAWTPRGGDIIFNGFDELEKPDTYDEASYDKYALDAADNVFNHFNTRKTLDPNKVYTVNMYHASSKKKERAFNEGDSVYGTHTGYLNYEPNTDTWYVTHNIDGVIHKDRFGDLQRKGNTNRVTAIFEPRKNTILNRTLTWLGFADGGILDTLASP